MSLPCAPASDAAWRASVIASFCVVARESRANVGPNEHWRLGHHSNLNALALGNASYSFLDINPLSTGHALVIPKCASFTPKAKKAPLTFCFRVASILSFMVISYFMIWFLPVCR